MLNLQFCGWIPTTGMLPIWMFEKTNIPVIEFSPRAELYLGELQIES